MTHLYLTQFITIIVVHFLAVASPGPDFLIVTKNSISQNRKIGILTAVGVALGIGVHITYCLFGIGLIISKSILIFNTIKYIGAGYLIWIGFKALQSKKKESSTESPVETPETINTSVEKDSSKIAPEKQKIMSGVKAIKAGFFVNVLNPKATLFFLAVFTQIIDISTPKIIQLAYGIEMITMTFIWFSIVAIAFSHSQLKTKIEKYQRWIDRTSGAVLVALGIKVALSKK